MLPAHLLLAIWLLFKSEGATLLTDLVLLEWGALHQKKKRESGTATRWKSCPPPPGHGEGWVPTKNWIHAQNPDETV